MKRFAILLVSGLVGLMAGCGSDGIIFNGVDASGGNPRQTPITHYNLPSEAGTAGVDVDTFNALVLHYTDFVEQPSPGHDLWLVSMYPGLPGKTWDGWTDNPTMPVGPPVNDIPDWEYVLETDKTNGGNWPDPTVTSTASTAGAAYDLRFGGLPPAMEFISTWVLSLQNQWFLRDIDGAELTAAVAGAPPVRYEGAEFSSMPISIIEGSQGATDVSGLASPGQREAIAVGPTAPGPNGVEQIVVPASNVIDVAYDGQGAPTSLLAAAWHEAPGENNYIEDSLDAMQNVPVPGGSPTSAGGGVYHSRFLGAWESATTGAGALIDPDDGVAYSYYLAVVCNHLIGFGVGLTDSAFALPGAITDQEDIMNRSVSNDMLAFIAAGKEFQFVVEDLLRMQDTANGDFMNPGPNSTLPGTNR